MGLVRWALCAVFEGWVGLGDESVNDSSAAAVLVARIHLLPLPALVNHAAQKQLWLSVFEDASEVPLYFGRSRRLACLG